jgi:hypothetical protein
VPSWLRRAPRDIWAYAYLIVPPQPENRLRSIRTIVDHEHSAAEDRARIWAGWLVREKGITHILIVSDSPEQNRGVNHRLETELKRLKAEFFLTSPWLSGAIQSGSRPHADRSPAPRDVVPSTGRGSARGPKKR